VSTADLDRELAETYERLAELHRRRAGDVRMANGNQKPEPKPRSRKQPRRPYVPKTDVSELDVARARQAAKRAGIPIR
jgi:hypothetical protein